MVRTTDVHQAMYGKEPKVGNQVFFDSRTYNQFLHRSFDWYNNCVKDIDKKKWVVKWAVENGFNQDDVKSIPESYLSTLGSMVRIEQNGFKFNQVHSQKMFSLVSELIGQFKEFNKKPTVKKRVVDKVGLVMTDFDEAIDSVFDLKTNISISINYPLSSPNINELKTYYKNQQELLETDHYLYRRFFKVHQDIIDVLSSHVNRRVRKPRVKKQVPKSKQVSKLKFMKLDKQLNIKSINPEKIIGAKKLVVFNTNNRKLTIFHADDQELGLQIKGSTLLNFSDSSSLKMIRQPQNKLPEFISATKSKTDKIFKQIKAISSPVTGRINSHCILLKIFN